MHNLGKVLHFEVVRTLKKPTFWITTLAMPALVGLIMAMAFFSNKSGTEQLTKLSNEQVTNVTIHDHTGYITPEFAKTAGLTLTTDDNASIAAVEAGHIDMFAIFPTDSVNEEIRVYGQDAGIFANNKYTTQATNILRSAVATSIGNEQSVTLLTKPTLATTITTFKDGEVGAGAEQVVAPLIFLVILYLIVILLSNQMLTATTEEKENRVTEIILTTIKPRALILGKILGLLILGIVQIMIIALPIIIAIIFFRQDLSSVIPNIDWKAVFSISPEQFLIGLGFLTGGLLLYTGILTAIGAAVPTAKDANSYFGVAIIAMFAPLYTFMLVLTDPNQPLVQVFSYFPLSAPVTMMIRNAFGSLELWQALIGLVIVYGTAVFALTVATRIFKYGTLEYSRRLSFKEIFSRKARA